MKYERNQELTMMDIKCDCGAFKATLKRFPRNTPGRLVCYCDDCQAYLRHLGRNDLLDENGGTEVIPAYPSDMEIVSGREHLKCTRLTSKGLFRFSTTCCNTPVANTARGLAWVGVPRQLYTNSDVHALEKLGPVRSRIMGQYAKGSVPAGTAKRMNLKAIMTVLPFVLKGKILGKVRPSPFFEEDGVTPVAVPDVLSRA